MIAFYIASSTTLRVQSVDLCADPVLTGFVYRAHLEHIPVSEVGDRTGAKYARGICVQSSVAYNLRTISDVQQGGRLLPILSIPSIGALRYDKHSYTTK